MSARIVPDFNELAPLIDAEREKGRSVVLTNGCFDVLHVGHARLIAGAIEEGDVLIVALNSDASARENKGPGRPHNPLSDRMEMIAALAGVHYVTSFGEPTAHALLTALRPDVHVKGTDWTPETAPERDVVNGYGGRIAICGDEKTRSSTDLISKL